MVAILSKIGGAIGLAVAFLGVWMVFADAAHPKRRAAEIAVALFGVAGGIIAAAIVHFSLKDSEQAEKEIAAARSDATEAKHGVRVLADSTPVRTGALVPGDRPSPNAPTTRNRPQIPESAMRVFIGSSLIWTETREFPRVIIRQGQEDMLTIEKADGGFVVSAKVFNKDGKIVCQITNNRFDLNTKTVFRIDRPSPSQLVVIDDEARMVLDIDFINPHTVRILGDFYLRDGYRASIREDCQDFAGVRLFGTLLQIDAEIPAVGVGTDGAISVPSRPRPADQSPPR
jgi:hypothetical protein